MWTNLCPRACVRLRESLEGKGGERRRQGVWEDIDKVRERQGRLLLSHTANTGMFTLINNSV